MSEPQLRLGTRGSALALAQSGAIAATVISELGRHVELVTVLTAGDVNPAAIAQIGGTGVFVTALRDALLAGEVDLAVHSFKDLPTAPAPGLVIAAVPVRADPRDALVARDGLTLGELPTGARIGKVRSGEVDAVVLARAGLQRLGRLDEASEVIDPLTMLPAPAQGALALECRADDPELVALLARLDDPDSRSAVAAERALLGALEAGCTAPVGALAQVAEGDDGPELYLRGLVAAVDGTDAVRLSATGPTSEAQEVGRRLAAELLDLGARSFLSPVSPSVGGPA